MEKVILEPENKCSCKDKKHVKMFCKKCSEYICSDCYVLKHIEHESDVVDLAEKCTRFLAEYQKLSRTATLLADRRQVHIRDESIEKIVEEIKKNILKSKADLQADINKSIDDSVNNVVKSPLVQDFLKAKREILGPTNEPLLKVKEELTEICKDLLSDISENNYAAADKKMSPEKFAAYQEALKKFTEASYSDIDFIHQIQKLKQTKVEYSYNPLAVFGMIRVDTSIKKPPRVIQFDRAENKFSIYNIETKETTSTEIALGFILPFRFVAVETANNVYLNGGDNNHGVYLKSHYLYDELRGTLIPLADMNEAKSRHSLVAVNQKNQIYAIGGENSLGAMKKCEYYDEKENKWVLVSKLNEARCSSAAVLNDTYIYVFGGWDKEYLSSVERLDIDTVSAVWEEIKITKKKGIPPVQSAGAVSIKKNEILIFGGYIEKEETSKSSYAFDAVHKTFTKKKDLAESDSFISSEIKNTGEAIYCFGYLKGGLFEYDISLDEWTYSPRMNLKQ